MKKYNTYLITTGCFAIGFLLFHPLAMVLGHIMHETELPVSHISFSLIILEFFDSYTTKMLPWSLIFGILNGLVGYYFISLKTQKELLKIANATKEKFVAIIAHDLRNPFLPLLGFTELLLNRNEKLDEAKRQKCISAIRDSALQIYKLLESLLEWSRLQSDNLEVHPTEINICDLTNELVLLSKGNAEKKGISIQSLLHPDTLVFGDLNMLSAILNNLVQNAIKFTAKGGKVEIGSRTIGNFVEITVADTGIGMTKAEMENLFRIDLKESKPGTENERGVGLGLILCKEFAEKNKGSISVSSQPGKGSRFTVKLPIQIK